MARPRRSQTTRKRLLEEGVAAFLEQGYHGTGIKDVLDRVDVPKGSFYNYFDSKEEFGAEAIRYFAEDVNQKLDSALGGASDPVTGLKKFFREMMRRHEQADYAGGCLVGNLGAELEGSDVCREALAKALRGWRERIRGALTQAQELGTVREDVSAGELADLLLDTWQGAVIRMKIEKSLRPLRQCLRRLIDEYFQA